jgi:hypothetical protein
LRSSDFDIGASILLAQTMTRPLRDGKSRKFRVRAIDLDQSIRGEIP